LLTLELKKWGVNCHRGLGVLEIVFFFHIFNVLEQRPWRCCMREVLSIKVRLVLFAALGSFSDRLDGR
jgi:hypothetical protein